MKFNFKRGLAIFLILIVVFTTFSAAATITASADAISDAKQQLEANKKKEQELNDKIAAAKKDKNKQLELKELYDQQIYTYQKKIDICNSLVAAYKEEIAKSEKKIEVANTEIHDTKEQFKKRLRSLYISNTNNSLQVIMGAESFSDFLIRLELTKCISAQDGTLIEKLTETISIINEEIKANKERQEEQNTLMKELKSDKSKYDSAVAGVNAVIKDINKDINKAESDKKALEDQNAYLNALIQGGDVDAVFDGKFTWPVPGHYYISSPWNCSCSLHKGNHKGIDIAGGSIRGKPIVAAASGWVTKYVNSCTHDYYKTYSCGCGNGFGNHVRLSHGQYKGNSYLTIYGHMKEVVAGMNNNKYYTRGQVIGYVGTSGFSAGNHLHFAVSVNSEYKNPSNYLK